MEIFLMILLNTIGFVLQTLTIFFAIYLFNKQKINPKQFITASVILSIISVLVRLLPISLGVHLIINMLFVYLICIMLLKMPAYITIRSTSLCVVLIVICEMIVTSIATKIYGSDYFENNLITSIQNALIGVLANLLFSLIILILFIINKKKGGNYRDYSSQDC